MPTTLYILYNAKSTLLGKLNYSYRHITAPKDQPACAACDLTHGGLNLDETAEWKALKEEFSRGGLVVVQQHRDEMGGDVKKFVEERSLALPVVLKLEEGQQQLEVVIGDKELAGLGGDVKGFAKALGEKGLLSENKL